MCFHSTFVDSEKTALMRLMFLVEYNTVLPFENLSFSYIVSRIIHDNHKVPLVIVSSISIR